MAEEGTVQASAEIPAEPAPPIQDTVPAEIIQEVAQPVPEHVPEATPVETPVTTTSTPPPPPLETPSTSVSPKTFLARALESLRFRKQKKLQKLVEYAVKKRSITNDDVEKLLRVSDATATRYLSQLVKEGRLKRSGPKFHETYEPLGGSIPAV